MEGREETSPCVPCEPGCGGLCGEGCSTCKHETTDDESDMMLLICTLGPEDRQVDSPGIGALEMSEVRSKQQERPRTELSLRLGAGVLGGGRRLGPQHSPGSASHCVQAYGKGRWEEDTQVMVPSVLGLIIHVSICATATEIPTCTAV